MRHRRTLMLVSLAIVLVSAPQSYSPAAPPDPFEFFSPTVVLSERDRGRLERGDAVARVLPASGRQLAVFAALAVDVSGDRLVAWARDIAHMRESAMAPVNRRFSDPPRLDDLRELSLDEEDVQDIRKCQPGRCGLKLAASEMLALQTALAEAGEDWHDAVQDAFRSVILSRVQTYIREGHGALPALNDSDDPVSPAAKLTSIVQQSEFLTTHLPDLAEYLTRYPLTASPEVESFLYWSQERLGGRPVIAVTHVAIVRPSSEGFPEVLIAGKQIFATHYMEGSLAITALVRGSAGGRYLVYVHRSEVDFLRGFWRKLVRMIVERRVKAEAPGLLQMLRRRLESGEPPGLTSWGDRGHAIEDEHGVSRSSGAQDDASGGACAPAESRHSAARAGGGRPASQRFSGPGAQVRSELKLLPPR